MTTGIDVIQVSRIIKLIKKQYTEKIFSREELIWANKFSDREKHLAGFFAVKEAVLKALGVGIEKLSYLSQISVYHEKNGLPFVKLFDEVETIYRRLEAKEIKISLSYCSGQATAICIII